MRFHSHLSKRAAFPEQKSGRTGRIKRHLHIYIINQIHQPMGIEAVRNPSARRETHPIRVPFPNTTCLGLVDLPKYLGGQCKDPLFMPLTATKCHAKPPGGLPRALASGAPEAPLEAPLAPESTWDGSKGGSRPMSSMARPWIEMD